MSDTKHEYAFDVMLCAVVRVKATDEASARTLLNALECEDVDHTCEDGHCTITEVSVDSVNPMIELFNVDGKDVEE